MSYRKSKFKIGRDFWDDDHAPPSSGELEQIVLGAILLESNSIHEVGADFSPMLFFDVSNQSIAETILEMWKNQLPIDLITVTEALRNNGKLQDIGGPGYLAALTNRIGSAANLEVHIKILQEMFLYRSITESCAKTIKRINSTDDDVFDIHADLQMQLDNVLKSVITFEVEKVGVISQRSIDEQYEVLKGDKLPGVPSGLLRLDKLTNGWQKTDLIIVAGRPGMGKTAFALSISLFPAIINKIPIAIFSLEMSKQQLTARMQSQISGVEMGRIVKKQLTKEENQFVAENTKALNEAPIYIDDTPQITLLELRTKARALVRNEGVELIVIDYLQLMKSGMYHRTKEAEVSEISQGVKALAKELNVPIIALAQLSRSVESRGGDKVPMLSDLRESGQIEQDADMVVFPYRPEYYGFEDYELDGINYETDQFLSLIVAKHRNGSTGEVPLAFIKKLARITNHSDDESDNSCTFVQCDVNEVNSKGLTPNKEFDSPSTKNSDWMERDPEDDDLPF